MKQKFYMAIDQYGQHYDSLEVPRRDLLKKLGGKKAVRMFRDNKEGESFHTGWIIRGLWLSVYEVIPMRKAA